MPQTWSFGDGTMVATPLVLIIHFLIERKSVSDAILGLLEKLCLIYQPSSLAMQLYTLSGHRFRICSSQRLLPYPKAGE